MTPFAALFPELAERECRTLRLSRPWFRTPRTKLPPDDQVLLADDDYVARLGRHCELVKAALNDPDDPIHARVPRFDLGEVPFVRAVAKVGRNEPCPCGTGKKSRRCCAKKPVPEGAAGAPSP